MELRLGEAISVLEHRLVKAEKNRFLSFFAHNRIKVNI